MSAAPPTADPTGSASTVASAPLPITSGHASEQGIRPTMEDEVTIEDSFHIPGRGYFSFFGVFDGHGGRAAAIFTRDHLFALVRDELLAGAEPDQALANAYINTDNKFIAACRGEDEAKTTSTAAGELTVKIPPGAVRVDEKDTSGTTAVSILLHHDTYTLYTANAGDSRAVLSGASGRVVSLTNDHKADRPDEMDRIRRAGGFVVHKRVMGELAISRAIGDLDFKEQGFLFVLADPELCTQTLTQDDEFVLLACDGIFDVMSNEQACTFVRTALAEGASLQTASEKLVRHSIDTLNTRDNVTAVLIRLATKEQLQASNVTPHAPSATTKQVTQGQLRDSHIAPPPPPRPASPTTYSAARASPTAAATTTTQPAAAVTTASTAAPSSSSNSPPTSQRTAQGESKATS